MNRRSFAGLAALAVAAVLGLQPAAAEEKPEVIRIASFGNAAGKPYGTGAIGVLRAQEGLEKALADEGIAVEWQFPRGTGPAINEAFANGQLDFAAYGGLPNIVGRGAGLKTRVLASYGVNPVYLVARPAAEIASVEDLRGKRIAVARGTINELSLHQVLAGAGLTGDDVTIYDLQSADQVSAVTAGDIDAVVGGGSSTLNLVETGLAEVVWDNRGAPTPGSSFGSFIVTDEFATRYPEITQQVVDAYVGAALFASDEANRQELYDIWALTGAPREAFARDFDGELLADRLSPLLDDFYRANIRAGVDFASSQKLIRQTFEVDEWVDPTFLESALDTLGARDAWTPRDATGGRKAGS